MSEDPSSPDALTQWSEVVAEAERLGLSLSDDRYDRWRVVDLVHHTKQRGFTRSGIDRVMQLLSIGKELRSKRPRASELAFWLCWSGETDVPPELVCEHIERTLLAFLGWLERECDRRRTPTDGKLRDSSRWEKAGRSWAKFVTKAMWPRFLDQPIVRELVAVALSLALRAILSSASFEAVSHKLKSIAFFVTGRDVPMPTLRNLWAATREAAELFSLDERSNKLLVAIREVRRLEPDSVIPLVHDTKRFLDLMGSVFPTCAAALAKNEPSDEGWVPVIKAFPPEMCAVLAAAASFPHAIEMRRQLRAGDTQQTLSELCSIKIVRDDIMARLSVGGQKR